MSLYEILDSVWKAGLIKEYHALRTLFELLDPTTVALWEHDMREESASPSLDLRNDVVTNQSLRSTS